MHAMVSLAGACCHLSTNRGKLMVDNVHAEALCIFVRLAIGNWANAGALGIANLRVIF